ncbi:hypothetical protein [Streptomyces wuyuanensis]|uniref:SCO2400 family protein n=1 Tax=Streptomyces wuyuanensis TaxID=1196353 RepID=UPI0037166A8E
MDYCTSCRRDLNGALVCPGCGAYAPDIAPPSHRHHGTSTVTARLATDGQDALGGGSYPSGAAYFDAPLDSVPPDIDPTNGAGRLDGPGAPTGDGPGADAGVTGDAATGQGRAARRRQLARWKKHRRRAAAATAVALVGGGLTIAALPSGKPSAGHTQASAPPEPQAAVTPSGSASPGGASAGAPAMEGSQRPGTDRRPTTRAHQRSADSAAPGGDTGARTGTGTTGQPRSAASSESTASRSSADRPTAPPSTPQVPEQAPGGSAPSSPAPEASPPPAAVEPPGPATPPAGLLPTPPGGSPVQVCLVGLCIG